MNPETRKLLETVAQQFQYYADVHGAKGTHMGNVKRDANLRFVKMIKEHLDGTTKSL